MSANISSITSEIDAIIAKAMEEYTAAKGVSVLQPEVPEVLEDIQESEPAAPPAIPVNSDSILVSEETSRFSGAVWFDKIQEKTVTLAGLGGIGSYVAFLLGRLHPEAVYLYDDDVVEAGNLSGQLYSKNNIGSRKAHATNSILNAFADYYNSSYYIERFTQASTATQIMMCGFDNMQARRTFFMRWKELVNACNEEDKKNCLFIDGRLAAESFQVLCIKGDDMFSRMRYEKEFLFSDEEAEETICSYKQTSFMANMIASVMVNLFVNFCANQCDPLVPRDLPFFTEYNGETMFFKVIA